MRDLACYGDEIRSSLTPEDRKILALLVECANDEMIARRMIISVRTVRRRIARLLELFGVENRFAAGVVAASLDLIAHPPPRAGADPRVAPAGHRGNERSGMPSAVRGSRSGPRKAMPRR